MNSTERTAENVQGFENRETTVSNLSNGIERLKH